MMTIYNNAYVKQIENYTMNRLINSKYSPLWDKKKLIAVR